MGTWCALKAGKVSTRDRARSMYEHMEPVVEEVADGDVELTKNYLETYCWLCAQIDVLQEQVDEDGVLVEQMVGNNKFQRVEKVEHPAIKTIVRLLTQKTAYYAKLHKVLADTGHMEEDELSAFLKGEDVG